MTDPIIEENFDVQATPAPASAPASTPKKKPFEVLVESRAFDHAQVVAIAKAFDLDTTPTKADKPVVQEDLYV
jgi:hypothetical protein